MDTSTRPEAAAGLDAIRHVSRLAEGEDAGTWLVNALSQRSDPMFKYWLN